MYTPKIQLARYVRDLLQQPENTVVVLGRENVSEDDLTALRIAIDTIGVGKRMNAAQKYDGDAEEMTHAQQWQQPCTVNFYGDDAYQEATKFMLISNGQRGLELQQSLGVAVYLTSGLTDVKRLTGEKFSSRFELMLNVQYTESAVEDVLRIDEAQLDIIDD